MLQNFLGSIYRKLQNTTFWAIICVRNFTSVLSTYDNGAQKLLINLQQITL